MPPSGNPVLSVLSLVRISWTVNINVGCTIVATNSFFIEISNIVSYLVLSLILLENSVPLSPPSIRLDHTYEVSLLPKLRHVYLATMYQIIFLPLLFLDFFTEIRASVFSVITAPFFVDIYLFSVNDYILFKAA